MNIFEHLFLKELKNGFRNTRAADPRETQIGSHLAGDSEVGSDSSAGDIAA